MAFTIFSFALVTALVAFISWLRTKNQDESTSDGYFLGGRSLTGIVICGSLMMTNLSAEQLVGRNGQGYAAGMTAMSWETMVPVALTLSALFFIPKFLTCGITTIPEFLEDRFDRQLRVLISFIYSLAYILCSLPLVLYSGSVVFDNIFHVSDLLNGNRFMAITIVAVALGIIGGIYAVFGGLKAVVVSDTLNGLIFIAGACLIVPLLAFITLGHGSFTEGLKIFATASPRHLNTIWPADAQAPYIPWPMIFIGCGINHISYWCVNQSIVQRVLGAKNLKEAQKGCLLAGLLCVFCPIFLVAPGIIQYIRDGGALGAAFDQAYPILISDILPKPVLGFFAAVMFGAILSSFNSVLNSTMTLFSLDILPAISKKERTAEQTIKIAKRFGCTLMIVSIVIAPFVMYIPAGIGTFLNQMWGYYGVPGLAIILMGLLNDRVPSIAPKIMLPFHIICYGVMMHTLPYHFLYFETATFLLDLLLLWIFAKVKPRETPYKMKDAKVVDMKPWKYRWPVIIVTFIILAAFYIIFSPLGLGEMTYSGF
jgi:SSS family solute:Na+ symporter